MQGQQMLQLGHNFNTISGRLAAVLCLVGLLEVAPGDAEGAGVSVRESDLRHVADVALRLAVLLDAQTGGAV